MSLAATITLPRGRYEAGAQDPRVPETVPSPYRLFCALVAVAARTGDPKEHAGLRWLERQQPPSILVPEVLDGGLDQVFFVTNRRANKGGSMTHPGRVNGAKHRAWVTFRGSAFSFVWTDDPDQHVLASLQELATGVTYLGRVESTARVQIDTVSGPTAPEVRELHAVELAVPGTDVAVPYTGALDALVASHERGDRAWETARPIRYASPRATQSEPRTGRLARMMVFRLLGQPVSASHLLDLTAAFRSAVMARVAEITGDDSLPPAVHGHARDVDHVAYLGLPFVGHPKADGNIRGLAVLLPDSLAEEELAVLGAALTGTGDDAFEGISFSRARDGRLPVQYDPFPVQPWLLRPRRWAGRATGTTTWATATPVMLDRFPKADSQIPDHVADALETAGYPRPSRVETSTEAFVPGGVRWRAEWRHALAGARPIRPVVHARVTFPEPVVGPVLAGSLRYRGCGVFVPTPTPPTHDDGDASSATDETQVHA